VRAGAPINTLLKVSVVLWCCGVAGCAYKSLGSPSPQPVTLSWAAVDTNDDRKKMPSPITYNVYGVPGAGPILTMQSKSCGVTTVAKGRPLNSEPIVGTTYSTSLAPGLWTFAVEAVSSDGCRSALSSLVTVTVPVQGDSPTNVGVSP
jgi:hypothetical protein